MSQAIRTYLITGGAGGIGLASASYLAARGARVMLFGRNPPPDEAMSALGSEARFYAGDVRSAQAIDRALDAIVEEFGLPDGVVTSAGIDIHHDFFDLTDKEFADILDVNVLGTFRAVQACARHWRKMPRKVPDSYAAVLISSVNACIATPTHTAYATSKGAIAQLTRVLAMELCGYGVRVNALGPGTVRTAMLDRLSAERPDALDAIMRRTPMGRVAEPEEIAWGVASLLSPEASYLTGQTLYVDGGRLAQNLSL